MTLNIESNINKYILIKCINYKCNINSVFDVMNFKLSLFRELKTENKQNPLKNMKTMLFMK